MKTSPFGRWLCVARLFAESRQASWRDHSAGPAKFIGATLNIVTPFVTFISPCATNNTRRMCSPCALYLTHGEHSLRRGSGCRRRFAVGHPRRNLRRVLNGLLRVPLAHDELGKSGSGTNIKRALAGLYAAVADLWCRRYRRALPP